MFNAAWQYRANALLYLAMGLALLGISYYQYQLGRYPYILAPALLGTAYLTGAVYRWLQSDGQQDYLALPLLLLSMALLWHFAHQASPLLLHWVYVLPLFTHFLLPVRQALALNVLCIAGVHYQLLPQTDAMTLLQLTIDYLLFAGIGLLFAHRQATRNRHLERLRAKDPITGSYNASHLQQRLPPEVSRARAMGHPLSLLMVTLDDLDQLEEHLGRRKAQQLLRKVCHSLTTQCRAGDEVYRYAPASFLMLLPNTTLNGCLVLRERIRYQLRRSVEPDVGHLNLTLTPITLEPDDDAAALSAKAQRAAQPAGG